MRDAHFAESLIAKFSLRVAAELERKRTEALLRDNEVRLRSLVDRAPVGIFEIDAQGRFLSVNAESQRLAGDASDAIGRSYLDTVADWDRGRVADLIKQSFEGRLCQFEYTSSAGERTRIFSATLIPLRGADGVPVKLLGYAQDITARKYSEERLIHRADHDSLTGLPNRGLFMDRLRSGIARARRNEQRLALLYADLNQFKPVNDDLGHQTGDRVLRLVAQRLLAAVREVDTVARIGGDEFAVILEAVSDAADATAVEAKIAETLGEPFFLDGHVINISASTGVAIYPDDGDDINALLQQADSEMYRAKRSHPIHRET
ncbi:MAG: GGDEF domain-containing protein, partial [Gammaproteobacteria bacterium]|nr:GGDEF domain-containing protein [Gammaproteobacteria bacterium]